jgi:molecular chaperone GrpE
MTGKSKSAAPVETDESAEKKGTRRAGAEKIRVYEKMAEQENPPEADTPSADDTPAEEDLQEALASARAEAADNYERFLRMSADFENFRKRSARDMDDLRKYATESLVADLLSVVDNLERAVQSSSEGDTTGSIREGVEMTLKEMFKVFDKKSVKQLNAMGEVFDPAFHQAIMQEESADHKENTVIREFQKGYTIHGRLLRPAMVVVAKESVNENDTGQEN